MKVGDLAKRAGLSVRTLHHYEEIGLLAPEARTAAGHRVYGDAAVDRLRRILSLKQLGMSLEEIRAWLAAPAVLLDAVRAHRARVRAEMDGLQSLARRLEIIETRMARAETVSVDDILEALEAMAMFEKYYTEQQLAQLEQRRLALGEETMRAVEKEWPELIARAKSAMQRGVDPQSEEMQAIAKRWQELIEMFTGGDPGIAASLANLYKSEPSMRERAGVDASVMDYVNRALPAGGG